LEIFENHTEVKKFYQSYYPLVVVDEFQDTNCIAWALLESVISEQTQLLFLGDPLQRIYGFIGALPDIMSKVVKEYGMTKVTLSKNYRFRNNPEMLKLDRSIRANAASCFTPTIAKKDVAELPIFWGKTQQDEAEKVVAKVRSLMDEENERIAILFRSRGKNAEIVEAELSKNHIPYFYGMFTDEDADYIEFHNKCQDLFIKRFGKSKSINKKALETFVDSVKTKYATSAGKTIRETLKPAPEAFEAHRKYADLMFMAEGEETVFYTPAAALQRITAEYDPARECLLAAPQPGAVPLPLGKGAFAIFFPQDAHAPGCGEGVVRRVVIKVPLD